MKYEKSKTRTRLKGYMETLLKKMEPAAK